MALAREGEAEGFWLRAERQTGGRGRQGRMWVSPPDNLYASTFVRVIDGDPPPATLAFVASLALHATVAALLADDNKLSLKWPNDLLLGGAKLSGILLEREGDVVVIGIGVNLAYHPTDLERPATSIADHASAPGAEAFLDDLAGRFAALLAGWRTTGLAPIRANWLRRAHPEGTPLTVHDGDGTRLEGSFAGLTEGGALRLRLADGSERVIHAGDVFLI